MPASRVMSRNIVDGAGACRAAPRGRRRQYHKSDSEAGAAAAAVAESSPRPTRRQRSSHSQRFDFAPRRCGASPDKDRDSGGRWRRRQAWRRRGSVDIPPLANRGSAVVGVHEGVARFGVVPLLQSDEADDEVRCRVGERTTRAPDARRSSHCRNLLSPLRPPPAPPSLRCCPAAARGCARAPSSPRQTACGC